MTRRYKIRGLLTIFLMHFFDLQEVKTITPNVVVEFITGSHCSQFGPRDLAQWMEVQIVNPMQNYPRASEET